MTASPRWDPEAYLTYAQERARPFLDLLARIRGNPDSIVDLGCGPGHLTPVLRQRWPAAHILGVDSSPEMIARAIADNADPHVAYELADVAGWTGGADLVVSNALLQWVPEQLDVLTRLTATTQQIALQVPDNFDAPSHRLLRELAARPPYARQLAGFTFRHGTRIGTYLELFATRGWQVDAWETSYQHILPGEDAVFDWMAGTGARPVLQALPAGAAAAFSEEYRAALRVAYPRQRWGTVLPYRRVFVVARRPERV